MANITQLHLKEVLDYDPLTGVFTWKNRMSKSIKNGDIAGTNTHGYIQIKVFGKLISAHRLAWLYIYGELPKYDIDHINNIKNDNRINNLRECSEIENCRNSPLTKRNRSGHKGVWFDKLSNKWEVRFRSKGKTLFFDRFDNLELASLIAQEVRNKYHGEFARHA